MNRWKILAFSLLPTLLLLAAAEVGWRLIYFQRHANTATAVGDLYQRVAHRSAYRIEANGPLYAKHPQLGFLGVPGSHDIRIISPYGTRSFRMTIGPDGYRITQASPPPSGRKKEIWIFGCSFTWGWGVDDPQTFPWLIHERFPDFTVRNFAVGAYGNVHALVQLQDLLKHHEPPAAAVFAYNAFHLARNVGATWWLLRLNVVERAVFQDISYLRAGMDPNGKLYTTLIPLGNSEVGQFPPYLIQRPDLYYEVLVTKEIFGEIKKLADRHGFVPVFAFQTPASDDAVAANARALGYLVADIAVPGPTGFSFRPIDDHPNEIAHQAYAAKLAPALQEALRRHAK